MLVDVAQGISHGIHRDGSVFLACRLEAFLDNLFGNEWANAVVDSHYAILIVRDERQSVLGRVEAGFAAIGYLVLDVEVVLFAELVPVCLLAFWQNQDDAQLWVVLMKTLDGAHQDRFACHWQKLLGNLASHAETLASGYYDYVIHILSEELKVKSEEF